MSDPTDVKAALQPLVDLLSKSDPTDTSLTPEEQAEFAARHEAEQKAEVENTRQQLLRSVVGPLERWQDGVLARLKAVEDKPDPVIPAPVIQKVAADPMTQQWNLKITATENGLAKTVVASADGKDKLTFTFSARTQDGFPRAIDVAPIG